MQVGFIGLGQMSAAMATNLVAAGHTVTVYNRSPEKSAALVDRGARVAGTFAEACLGQAVITMLADDIAAEGIGLGEAGVVATLRPGAVHISMSTISVALAERLTAAHAAAGQRFVAAPVFEAIGQWTFHVGDTPSAANLIKLSGNFLLAVLIESLSEAVALVAKAGIDRKAYVELLTSPLFPAPAHRVYGSLIAEQRFAPAGFLAPLGLKDVRLALAAARDPQVPMPLPASSTIGCWRWSRRAARCRTGPPSPG